MTQFDTKYNPKTEKSILRIQNVAFFHVENTLRKQIFLAIDFKRCEEFRREVYFYLKGPLIKDVIIFSKFLTSPHSIRYRQIFSGGYQTKMKILLDENEKLVGKFFARLRRTKKGVRKFLPALGFFRC